MRCLDTGLHGGRGFHITRERGRRAVLLARGEVGVLWRHLEAVPYTLPLHCYLICLNLLFRDFTLGCEVF